MKSSAAGLAASRLLPLTNATLGHLALSTDASPTPPLKQYHFYLFTIVTMPPTARLGFLFLAPCRNACPRVAKNEAMPRGDSKGAAIATDR